MNGVDIKKLAACMADDDEILFLDVIRDKTHTCASWSQIQMSIKPPGKSYEHKTYILLSNSPDISEDLKSKHGII